MSPFSIIVGGFERGGSPLTRYTSLATGIYIFYDGGRMRRTYDAA